MIIDFVSNVFISHLFLPAAHMVRQAVSHIWYTTNFIGWEVPKSCVYRELRELRKLGKEASCAFY